MRYISYPERDELGCSVFRVRCTSEALLYVRNICLAHLVTREHYRRCFSLISGHPAQLTSPCQLVDSPTWAEYLLSDPAQAKHLPPARAHWPNPNPHALCQSGTVTQINTGTAESPYQRQDADGRSRRTTHKRRRGRQYERAVASFSDQLRNLRDYV